MAASKTGKGPSTVGGRLGGPPKKARKHQKSPQQRAVELRDQNIVFELTVQGFTAKQIAERLQCSSRRAARLVARALDEYLADRDQQVHAYMAKGLAQADSLLRTWMPRARGYVKLDEEGNPVRDDKGRQVRVDPDPRAAMICARVLRDRNMLIGYGQTVKVEHTGAGGGPILTANIGAMEAAAKVRERFANAPRVILSGDQTENDVPDLAKRH